MDRYFHLRIPGSCKGGATILVSGEDGCTHVMVGVAICSMNDNFSRREGRQVSERRYLQHPRRVPLASLPNLLLQTQRQILRRAFDMREPEKGWPFMNLWNYDFNFSKKYWTPRAEKIEDEGNGGAPAVADDAGEAEGLGIEIKPNEDRMIHIH